MLDVIVTPVGTALTVAPVMIMGTVVTITDLDRMPLSGWMRVRDSAGRIRFSLASSYISTQSASKNDARL
jgi:hypothetical protein